MRNLIAIVLTTLLLITTRLAVAQGQYVYYGIEPEITTNYLNNKPRLGYVKLTVELMIKNPNNLEVVEHHAPLLRDAIIAILGKASEENIRSLTGREEVRNACAREIKRLLKKETGSEVIRDVLFTKYLYFPGA